MFNFAETRLPFTLVYRVVTPSITRFPASVSNQAADRHRKIEGNSFPGFSRSTVQVSSRFVERFSFRDHRQRFENFSIF